MPRMDLRTVLTLTLIGAGLGPAAVPAQPAPRSMFSDLMTLTDSSTARISSFDRSGGNEDFVPIAPGKKIELARIEGAGIIRHLYFSILGGRHYLRDLALRMYWDGAERPSVEVPFGDFFGLGHERVRFYTSLMITVNPGDLGVLGTYGFNSYFPMPFAEGARLTLSNEGNEPVTAVWYHVEYEKLEALPDDLGRFHASWNRQRETRPVGEVINETLHDATNTTGKENYVVLDTEGQGNLAGFFLNIDNTMGSWYGEGDDMIFVDGEAWPPSYHGTGSEEVFGGGACPTAEYAGPYTGFHLIGNLDYTGKVSMYRFYVNDPIRFQKSIRMTIEHGHANNIANDYSSTVFWYQRGARALPKPLPPAAERHPRDGDDPHDRAYDALLSLRPKALAAWYTSLRGGRHLPDDIVEPMKRGISKAYFERDYETVLEQCAALAARLDRYLRSSDAAAGSR